VSGDFAAYFGLDGGINDFAVGGWSMGAVSNRVWHAGNDGSGSGLDADKVDGLQASQFVRSDTSDELSGNYNTTGTWLIGGTYANNAYNSVSSTRLLFGGGNDQSNYHIGTNMENFGGNYTKLDLRWHTGIRMGAQPNYGGIRFYNNEDLTTVLFSIGKGDGNVRIESGELYHNTSGSSDKYWREGNDGSGSGLDADLLDGQQGSYYSNYNNLSNKPTIPTNNNQLTNGAGYITSANGGNAATLDGIDSSQFLRSDTSDQMNGELNVTHNGGITGGSAPTYYQANIEVQTSSNYVPAIGFHRGGYSATTIYEYDGELYVNPWTARDQTGKLLTLNNLKTVDGSGSGLDADSVDGIQGANIITDSATQSKSIVMRNNNPTLFLRDTDHNSAMVHVNSHIFYVLRGGNDTTGWTQVNSAWPLEINLTNNDATFGRN